MRQILLFFICVCFGMQMGAQTVMGRQNVDQFPRNSSGVPTYGLTWLPQTYNNTTRRYPLIISLHGAGETGTIQADLSRLYTASPRAVAGRIADGWNAVAVNPLTGIQDSFIVVSPQASSWSYSYTELKFILPNILSRYRVDTSRIYLTGLSAGGGGTFSTFGSRDSAFIKKFAAMSTASSAGTNASNGYTAEQVEAGLRFGSRYGVRMWTIAGEQDYLLNVDVRYHDSTNMFLPTPANKLTVLAQVGHSSWGRAYDPAFRPVVNYYGRTGNCQNGCNNGGITVAPNNNGSTVRGSGVTQDSLNIYEWFLLSQRTFEIVTTPTANAGNDQVITLPSNSVTLNGVGTAGSGHTIAYYTWAKISGPSPYTIVSPSNASTNIISLVPGTYTFRLTVTNEIGATASDDVLITVNDPIYGSPVISSITPDQTITLPTNSVNLASSYNLTGASFNTIKWSKFKVPGQVKKKIGIIGSSTSQGNGASSTDSSYVGRLRNFFVAKGLVDSVINFGMSGHSVFKGMPSSYIPFGNQEAPDPSRNITAILNRNVDVVIVNYPSNGYDVLNIGEIMMAFRTIFDSCVARGVKCYITTTQPREDFGPTTQIFLKEIRDSILIRFGNNSINFYDPVTTPGTTMTMPVYSYGDQIHLNNSGHLQLFNKVIAADILNSFTNSASLINTPANQNTSVSALTQGVNMFQVTLTDSHQQSISAYTTITVNSTVVNQSPTANAGADQIITLPTNLASLNGSGTDPDGMVVSYQWTKIAGPAQFSIVTASMAQTAVNNLVQGVYHFVLTVTDNQGATGRDTVVVTVNAALPPPPPANQAPTANAGANQIITLPTNSASLNGSGTDPDGTVVSYQWTKIAGPAQYSILAPTQAQTLINTLIQGIYSFELRVTDNQGAIGRDTLTLTVNAPTSPGACTGTSFTPVPGGDRGYYNTYNLQPGDTLYLDGSHTFSYVYLFNRHGTANCPIIITNKNGQARLRGDELKLENCSYIKVLGNGDPNHSYGISIRPYGVDTIVNGKFGINILGKSKNIEIGYVKISNAGMGMSIKHDPDCDTTYNYPNYVMDSITIHNNHITQTWNQGLYIGNTAADNNQYGYSPRPIVCSGDTVYYNPMRLGHVKVYNNYIDSTGRGGIQLSASSHGLNEIYNNTVKHSGMNGDEAQGNAIVLGAYTSAHIYNNTVSNTYTHGIASEGGSNTDTTIKIWNNSIDSSGYLRAYDLSVTNRYEIKISNEPTFPNNLSWPYSTFIKTIFQDNDDSTRFNIRNNQFGRRKRTFGVGIFDQSNTIQANGNIICGNINTLGGSVTVNVEGANVVTWGNDCNSGPNQLPTAHAGTDQTITLPTNLVTFTGSGTDPDGTIASYQWTKITGPAQFNIVSATAAQTVVNNLVQGVYSFELRVTDNQGGIGRDTVVVTVNAAPPPPNQLPSANAGANQTITLPTNSVTFTGSGTDPDGTIASYQWTKITGPAQFNIVAPTAAQTVVNNLVQGVYSFELRVTDNQGGIGRDTVVVTVNAAPPANQAPIANAGPDQTLILPTNTTTLNGSGTDPDGTIVSYDWSKISGPAQFVVVSPAFPQTVINNLVQGVYQFVLTVTDNQGATGRDTVVVTVNAAPPPPPPANQAPTANAGANQSITLPTNTVNLSGSGTDPDGTIASYQWTKIAGPAQFNIVSASSAQTAVNSLVQGVYQFVLTVTDNQGATGRDTVVVTVNAAPPPPPPANQAPTANAGIDQNITLPTNTVNLNGSGTDPDGTIVTYQWTKIAGPGQFNIVSASAAQTIVNNLVQGVYQFVLTVTDNQGANGRDTVVVTVNAAPPPVNQAPAANAGADRIITLPVNSVLISGNGTDPDGTIVTYRWTKISGPSQYTIVAPNQAQTEFTNLVQGVYEFELAVTDNQGAIARDIVRITVEAEPQSISTAKIFPNPAVSTINIRIDAVTNANKTKITIVNMAGMIVFQKEVMRTQQVMVEQVDVSRFAKGSYVITIGLDINNSMTLLFIKK
ncbi:MAG: T9SS type A sorting domain-containing protein [Chitinophagaceae bacterium]|nr:T9SS type A sorting domain-containing protein [Chitinophagaceae bacterium]